MRDKPMQGPYSYVLQRRCNILNIRVDIEGDSRSDGEYMRVDNVSVQVKHPEDMVHHRHPFIMNYITQNQLKEFDKRES